MTPCGNLLKTNYNNLYEKIYITFGFDSMDDCGFARLDYDKYLNYNQDLVTDKGKKNYFGPTKGGLSLMYVF